MRAMLIFPAAAVVALVAIQVAAQTAAPAADPLTERGQVVVGGRPTPYLIHHLPVNSYPDLPPAVAEALSQRGCSIPQTYQAHRPENVVHGSFERAGSSDWAVLCAVKGTVTLLVFFGAADADAAHPQVVNTASETSRLFAHDASGVLGFDWGIDAAPPQRVHDAQSGIDPRPALPDHDALADSIIDRSTTYRLYKNNKWLALETPR